MLIEVFAQRVYDAPELKVSEASRVLDLGANIGCASIWFARQSPRVTVVAVEPAADTCDRLRADVRQKRLDDRVEIVHAAMGGEDGVAYIGLADRSMIHATSQEPGQGHERLDQVTVERLLALAGGSVDVLKSIAREPNTMSSSVLRSMYSLASGPLPASTTLPHPRSRRGCLSISRWPASRVASNLTELSTASSGGPSRRGEPNRGSESVDQDVLSPRRATYPAERPTYGAPILVAGGPRRGCGHGHSRGAEHREQLRHEPVGAGALAQVGHQPVPVLEVRRPLCRDESRRVLLALLSHQRRPQSGGRPPPSR